MTSFPKTIYHGITLTFNKKLPRIFFLTLWPLLFAGMFAVPALATPGNTITIQAALSTLKDYIILIALSGLTALALAMHIYILQEKIGHRAGRIGNAAWGGFGATTGILSSVFATASCALCVGTLFSFLSFGAVLFLIESRLYIIVASFCLLLTSIYFSAKRISDDCTACAISSVSPHKTE